MSDDLVLTRRDNLLNYAAHVAALEAETQVLREEIALLEEGARERSEYLVGVIEERERLRRALEPFADHARDRCVDDAAWSDANTVSIVVTIRDLRATLEAK